MPEFQPKSNHRHCLMRTIHWITAAVMLSTVLMMPSKGFAICPAGPNIDCCPAGPNIDCCPAGPNIDCCTAGPNGVCGTFPVLVQSDSMLKAGDRNTNEGANPILAVSGSGNTRIVLDFGPVPLLLCSAPTAILELTIADNGGNWGPAGKFISVHPLLEAFTEGNGMSFGLPPNKQVKGSGPGVTWLCPTDSNIANQATDCSPGWSGGEFGEIIDSVLITNDTTGVVQFDITAWLRANPGNQARRFLIKKDNDGAPGEIEFFSREGAASITSSPVILLECTPI